MARIVTVQPGFDNVQLPDRGVYSAGQTVVLTEEEFADLAPGIVGTVVSDDGATGDTVTAQGATVTPIADPATATAPDTATKVNELITELSGDGRALAGA